MPMQTPEPHVLKRLSALLFTAVLALSPLARAQARPPAPPAPALDPAPPRVAPARPSREANTPSERAAARARNPVAGSARTLRLAPAGRWWDDASYTRNLAINPTQQRRMDQVFGTNREQLLKLYTNLKHEEGQLDKLGKGASETQLDQQIDKVAQARTELEKADTHLLLEIRKQLTPEQLSKLDAIQ